MDWKPLIDIAGWLGVFLLLLAYWLVSTRRLTGNSTLYQILNAMGSALLIVNSLFYRAFPSVGVNIAWIGIALYTLWRIWKHKEDDPSSTSKESGDRTA